MPRKQRLPPVATKPPQTGDDGVNHPSHYGGKENPYEAIKVIEAHGLGFSLGNAVKYILRAGKKERADSVHDLKKAIWYINRAIERIEDGTENPP